jgi:tetraacyldisaccharide 4'-kinase
MMKKCLYNLATDEYRGFIPAVAKVVLFLLSVFYGLIVRAAILFYRLKPCCLGCKVISVGNITLGGTGKTSLVEYTGRYLSQQGKKIAILSRGYKSHKVTRSQGHNDDYEAMGDEPYMLSKKLGDIPLIVDPDRIRAASLAMREHGAGAVILDDGFQQWKIKKDLEIVCIDAVNPFGNRHLLPRGILREPVSSLKRADIFVLTKTNLNPDAQGLKDFLRRINPAAQVFESAHRPLGFYAMDKPDELIKPDSLKGKTAALFCGIGDPGSFEALVKGMGINVGASFRFPDHHKYSEDDLGAIVKSCREKDIDTIITTEKDAVRLRSVQFTCLSGRQACLTGRQAVYSVQCMILRIELQITRGEDEFHNRLLGLYSH